MFDFARKALFAALLAGVAMPAIAADYYDPPVEVVPVYRRLVHSRPYRHEQPVLRWARDPDLYNDPASPISAGIDEGGFASAPIFGGGVGYKFNDYLRGDLTVEYRGKSDFNALDW